MSTEPPWLSVHDLWAGPEPHISGATGPQESSAAPAMSPGISGELRLQQAIVTVFPPVNDVDGVLVRIQKDVETVAE